MRPTTKNTKNGSLSGENPTIQLSIAGYTLLDEIRGKMSQRLYLRYGLNFEDSRDLAGDLVARCCCEGLSWLCSKEERHLLEAKKLPFSEDVLLKRMLRAKFLSNRSIDFVRKQHAAMRDTRRTESLDRTMEIDGEELPAIQISYNEPRMDINHIIEAKDELAHVTRTTLPHLSKKKRQLFEAILVNPQDEFHSADLALVLEGNDRPETRKRIASRSGEVRDEVRRVFRMKSDKPRPDFN